MNFECDKIIVDALKEAGNLRNTYLGSEHLLLAILKNKDFYITQLLNAYGMYYEKIRKDILYLNYQYGLGEQFEGYSPVVSSIVRKSEDAFSMVLVMLKESECIQIAERLGHSKWNVAVKHMLPHLLPQFVVGLVLMFPHAILHEAAISFLGYGLPPDQPAIGIILAESMNYLSAGLWWPAVFPGLTLLLIVLLVDRLGDNLRMILDPYSAQE